MRSRAVRRSFLCCDSIAFAPPPCLICSSSFLICVSRSIICRLFFSNAGENVSTRLPMRVLLVDETVVAAFPLPAAPGSASCRDGLFLRKRRLYHPKFILHCGPRRYTRFRLSTASESISSPEAPMRCVPHQKDASASAVLP